MASSKPRILIVEDVTIAQKMAVMVLSSLSCEADVAATGVEAIAKFNQDKYDLILLDLGLPDMDGFSVAKEIREQEAMLKTHTPIIALTAHVSDDVRQSSFNAGVDGFISKPLTVDIAKELIDKYIRHHENN